MNDWQKGDRVDLHEHGLGTIIGLYWGNFYPIHIMFDSGECVTFSQEDFEERLR